MIDGNVTWDGVTVESDADVVRLWLLWRAGHLEPTSALGVDKVRNVLRTDGDDYLQVPRPGKTCIDWKQMAVTNFQVIFK